MTIFYEGSPVEWTGGGFQAEGHIVVLGTNAAHVKWTSGPSADQITFTDLFDIEPVTASAKPQEDPLHLTAVRRAFDNDREVGVLNFLASNKYLASWPKIAQDVIAYTEARIQADSSMELVDEQLSIPERNAVVTQAALALLRDAFADDSE